MGIERNFDVAFVAEMALREKQIQQNYRPVIGAQVVRPAARHALSRVDPFRVR